MRILPWLLVVIMLAPGAAAMAWEDEADDHELGRATHRDGGEPTIHWAPLAGTGQYPNVDILEAAIEETEDALTFSVGVTATEPSSVQAPGTNLVTPDYFSYQYLWRFDFHGESLYAGFTDWQRFDFTYFSIFTLTERDGWVWQNDRVFVMAEDRDDMAGWTATVPKWWIRDADMVPIREGDRLEGITFHAQDGDRFGSFGPCPDAQDPADGPFTQGCRWYVRDLLQDGQDLGTFTVEKSPPGVGHLFVRIDEPVRQSNGLATTYLFEAQVHNLEETPDSMYIQVEDIPQGWEVHHPPVVDFDGAGKETVPIAVTVPFSHEHGASHWMGLTVVSDRDPQTSMESSFGVLFAEPAQPAGHHATLHFHSDEEGDWGWMNTRLEEEQASKEPVRSFSSSFIQETYRASWDFGLQPGLAIGLDFDTQEPAEAVFDLELPIDGEAEVTGALYLYDWRNDVRTDVATGSTTLGFTSGTPTEVRISMAIDPVADRLPYDSGRNLYFEVNVTSDAIVVPTIFLDRDGDWPRFHTQDAALDLPLFDYHEEVDLSGLSLSRFNVAAQNGTFRGVNPGNTTVFAYNITNLSDAQYTIEWELRGEDPGRSWASFTPATTHLAPGGTSTLVLRVQAPTQAQDGDAAEYLLIGRIKEDPDLQVFARATAMVMTDVAIPDESAQADSMADEASRINDANKKESPGPALILVGLGLLWAARRRH